MLPRISQPLWASHSWTCRPPSPGCVVISVDLSSHNQLPSHRGVSIRGLLLLHPHITRHLFSITVVCNSGSPLPSPPLPPLPPAASSSATAAVRVTLCCATVHTRRCRRELSSGKRDLGGTGRLPYPRLTFDMHIPSCVSCLLQLHHLGGWPAFLCTS